MCNAQLQRKQGTMKTDSRPCANLVVTIGTTGASDDKAGILTLDFQCFA